MAQVHGLQSGNDLLPVGQGAVWSGFQQRTIRFVGDDLGAGTSAKEGRLAFVVAVGNDDVTDGAQGTELFEVGVDHGNRVYEDVVFPFPHPQMTVEIDLAILVEDGPRIEFRLGLLVS